MFRSEAEKLKEIYDSRVEATQEQMDDYLAHAMPFLRELVGWYDRHQEVAMAARDLKMKLENCEECDD